VAETVKAGNYLPPELASKLLETQKLEDTEVSPEVEELLYLQAEECAETVQRCTKILRFGLRINPWTGEHNRETLERELGDILAVARLLQAYNVISLDTVAKYSEEKIEALRKPDGRLRVAKVPEWL